MNLTRAILEAKNGKYSIKCTVGFHTLIVPFDNIDKQLFTTEFATSVDWVLYEPADQKPMTPNEYWNIYFEPGYAKSRLHDDFKNYIKSAFQNGNDNGRLERDLEYRDAIEKCKKHFNARANFSKYDKHQLDKIENDAINAIFEDLKPLNSYE